MDGTLARSYAVVQRQCLLLQAYNEKVLAELAQLGKFELAAQYAGNDSHLQVRKAKEGRGRR